MTIFLCIILTVAVVLRAGNFFFRLFPFSCCVSVYKKRGPTSTREKLTHKPFPSCKERSSSIQKSVQPKKKNSRILVEGLCDADTMQPRGKHLDLELGYSASPANPVKRALELHTDESVVSTGSDITPVSEAVRLVAVSECVAGWVCFFFVVVFFSLWDWGVSVRYVRLIFRAVGSACSLAGLARLEKPL